MSAQTISGQLLGRYREQIGRARNEVTTPALLLDLDVARRNITKMAQIFSEMPARLRPHIKVHKSVELSRMIVDAGAVGVACATPWEAIVMARGGIEDVLVANQVVQRDQVARLAELARDHRLTLTVDDVRNVDQLSRAATAAGSRLDVLLEVDVGMARCGVRTLEDLVPIAARIAQTDNLRLRGIQAYEGHCMLEPDRRKRVREANAANERAIQAADLLGDAGHPCEEISAGGTGTYFITGANPRITEVQAGSYTLMDRFHADLVPGGFEIAMTVLGTVISRQGHTVVLDCGRKAIGIDFVTPELVGVPGIVRYWAEEHCLVDFPGQPTLAVGDTAEAISGYGPTTVNLHEVFHVVENGVVTDIWPVNPRGAGPPL
jgi:D-serine deaminase-like pyridoxal phosphate-dependent protein